MPVPKRYFKVSQEINHDPEMWTLTEKYGERALRTWLEILVYLDKTQNRWRMVDGWLGNLSRAVRQTPASVSRTVGQLLANGWLEVLEATADGSPSVVGASNWTKYNRTQEQKGNGKNKTTVPSFPTPTPTPTPSLPKTKKKRETHSIPENWFLSDSMKAYGKEVGMSPSTMDHEFQKCKHHHRESRFTERGWSFDTWKTWAMNWVSFGCKQAPPRSIAINTVCSYANEECEENAVPGSKYCQKHKDIITNRQAQRKAMS